MDERYIAAIEISSSKIIAAVGKTRGNGVLDVIAVEQENTSEGMVRYGIIQNLEETAMGVTRVFNRLEQRSGVAPRKIKGVIVGLAGRSVRNITNEVSLSLPDDTEITDEILQRLREQAMHAAIDNTLEIIDAVPRVYKIEKTETSSPKGMIGNSISATFDLIVCRPELKRNIRRTITDKLHLDVQGFVVTAMATGHLILSSEEKRLGCMLADIGSETTTVTIYKNGALRYFATIPMGGRNITRDISTLGIVEAKAEEIKKTSVSALADDDISSLTINGLKLSDISNLVVARSEEIVANIVEQMEYAGLKESELPGGIVCIGGGSKLKGIRELLSTHSDLPVREGKLPDYVRTQEIKSHGLELAEVASVLYAGATLTDSESLEMPVREGLPINGELPFEEEIAKEEPKEQVRQVQPRKQNKFLENIGRRLGNLFGNPEDDDSELI